MNPEKISKFLWLSLATTFPLFCVEFLRYDILGLEIAIPMAILALIIFIESILSLVGNKNIPNPFIKVGYFLSGLLLLFIFWHVISLAFFDGLPTSIKNLIKLIISLGFFFGVTLFFPKEQKFIERFWFFTFFSSALLMAVLSYRYAFVHKVPSLSTSWEYKGNIGRNSLTWYLVFIIPMATSYLLTEKRKVAVALCLLMLTTALIYSGGRGGAITIFLSIIFITFTRIYLTGIRKNKRFLLPLLSLILMIGIILWVIPQFVEEPEFLERYNSLSSDHISGLKDEKRYFLLLKAWNGFLSSPFYGVGLGKFSKLGLWGETHGSHNDYLLLLAEQGLIGCAIFVAIIFVFWARVWPQRLSGDSERLSWVFVGNCGVFFGLTLSFFQINVYKLTILWLFLGLLLVSNEIQYNNRIGGGESNNKS